MDMNHPATTALCRTWTARLNARLVCAGCPAAVANLWDVTDRDIDRFSQALLDDWTRHAASSAGAELAGTLTSSRGSCRLPFLTGAAPVCFGIPSKILGSGPA